MAKEKAVKAPKVDKKTAKKIAEKKSSANKLRDLTNEQLVKKIDDLKQEIFNLRFQAAVGKLENTAGLRKAKKAGAKIDLESLDFYNRVREGYLIITQLFKDRVVKISGDQPLEKLAKEIYEAIDVFLRGRTNEGIF